MRLLWVYYRYIVVFHCHVFYRHWIQLLIFYCSKSTFMSAFLGDCDIWMLPFIHSDVLQKNDRSCIRDVFIFSIFTKIRTCFCVLQEAGELYEKGHSRVRLLWRYWRSTLPARGFWFMSLELVLIVVVVCLMRWNRSIAGYWTHTGTYSYWKKPLTDYFGKHFSFWSML